MPSAVDLPDLGIKLGSPELQVDSLPVEVPGNPCVYVYVYIHILFIHSSLKRYLDYFYVLGIYCQ